MALIDFSDAQAVKPAPDISTMFMAGVVGTGLWEVWSRQVAHIAFSQDLSFGEALQFALHIEQRIFAELLFIGLAIAILPIAYLYIWQPLMRLFTLTARQNWFVDGLSYGVILSAPLAYFGLEPITAEAAATPVWAWIAGVSMAALGVAGIIRLMELGRKVI
ncbi:MAG: hypothetical protein AAGE61_07025 [Pseudomonadota bacterium]